MSVWDVRPILLGMVNTVSVDVTLQPGAWANLSVSGTVLIKFVSARVDILESMESACRLDFMMDNLSDYFFNPHYHP